MSSQEQIVAPAPLPKTSKNTERVLAKRWDGRAKRKSAARKRDPHATREALLRAAREVLSRDGAEGLQVTRVARRAGVTRATAYLHFRTRDQLLKATAEWVSDALYAAVFDYPAFAPDQPLEAVSASEMIQHLSGFAMDNPELCGIWLQEVLSSDQPGTDKFWCRYMQAMERFAASDLAHEGLDVEVHTVLMLAGTFLWPVWIQSQARSAKARDVMASRFRQEMMRLAFNGVLRPAEAR
jgi:AcrR family transcriptional regulator